MLSYHKSRVFFQFGVLYLVFSFPSSLTSVVKIGGLMEENDKEIENAYQAGVDRINGDSSILPTKQLSIQLSKLNAEDTFHTFQAACQLLSSGIIGFIGPTSLSPSSLIQSASSFFEIPHVHLQWDYRLVSNSFSLFMYPSIAVVSRAFRDIVETRGWKSYTIVYEDNEALIKLKELLKRDKEKTAKVSIRQLKPGMSYKKLVKDIGKQGETNIIVDISTWRIKEFFKEARDIGMMTEYHNYLITSLDVHTVDLRDFQRGRTNITCFQLVSPVDNQERWEWVYKDGRYKKVFRQETLLKTQAALVYDALKVFALSVHNISYYQTVRNQKIFCDEPQPWKQGSLLLSIMKKVKFKGLTGLVEFDQNGMRTSISLDILELKEEGLKKVGSWNQQTGVKFTTPYKEVLDDVMRQLRNRTLKIVTIINPPYTMLKEPTDQLNGNDQFEGYCVDIIREISRILGFKYHIHLVRDGAHGTKSELGEWNGMIRELIDKEADLILADLTITYEREEAVDFTMPFMNLGISILFRKPMKKVPKLFSFLSPLSFEVWIYMATAYLGVSILLFILARLTPYEWVPSHPCDQDSGVLENQFTLLNSFWFTIGSLMQQGTEIAPKTTSTRIIATMWWFFTLIMISSYTANLAAFLTIQRMKSPIESADDLAAQTSIQYGCLNSGSTKTFFKESNIFSYKKMWAVMQAQPSVFTDSNQQGVERVLKGNYAYFMESTSIEYITERNCELEQIGGLLDSKGYGIATPEGSPYRTPISNAILRLQEDGVLHLLKEKWWSNKKEERCGQEEKKTSSSTSELDLANVGGMFVVLLAGLGFACIISVIEFIWKTKRLSKNERNSVILEFAREIRNIICCVLSSYRVKISSE